MSDNATTAAAAITVNQARFFRNGFKWNYRFDVCEAMGVTPPASNAGRDAWKAFYADFSDFLTENIGAEAVKATLDYFGRTKKSGKLTTALDKAGIEVDGFMGPAPTPAPTAAPTAAPADARAILATAFAEGTISIADFTAAIAALEGPSNGATKVAEVPEPEVVELALVGTDDDDLPF